MIRSHHICVFGASGRTGRAIVNVATLRGYEVTAVCRSSISFEGAPTTANIVLSDFSDDRPLNSAINHVDVVLCAIGPRPPYNDIFCADATRSIIRAMTTAGIRRLICITGAMIGKRPTSRSRFIRTMMRTYRNRTPASAADRDAQEQAVIESGLDWTIVRPPRLTDGRPHGRFRSGEDLPVTAFARISRHDLARFMVDQIDSNDYLQKCPIVRY